MAAIKKIPLIDWEDCLKLMDFKNISEEKWKKWIFADIKYNKNLYALSSTPIMEPFFPKATILIFKTTCMIKNGDWVVANNMKKKRTDLCELYIDHHKKNLFSLCSTEKWALSESELILGKIIRLVFSY